MMFLAAFADLAALLTALGTVVTGVLAWGIEALATLELAVAESFVLQLSLGIVVTYVGIALLKYIVGVVKSFLPKGAKA